MLKTETHSMSKHVFIYQCRHIFRFRLKIGDDQTYRKISDFVAVYLCINIYLYIYTDDVSS